MKSKLAEKRFPLRKRWNLCVFLPICALVIIALGVFLICAQKTLGRQFALVAIFCACFAAAVIAAAWFLGHLYLKSTLKPLEQLNESAAHIAEGTYGIRTEKAFDDEIGDLTESINSVSERVVAEAAVQSEFISSVSHELRTPLTAVTGWAEEMAYDETIQGDSRRGLEIIAREAARLTKMVNELLEFTRIQDGRFYLDIERIDIVAETEDAVMAYSKLMQKEKLDLCFSASKEVIPIEGDGERLRQVVLNLLDNAAKYGKNGEKVEVSVISDDKYVTISVRDYGTQIPEDELPRIKERFYKGSGKERGSGIGLAVCDEIVVRHGGTLSIENAEGGGVLAKVRLPQKQ